MMGVFIVIIIVGVVIWAAIAGTRMKNTQDALQAAFVASHRGWEVYASPFDGTGNPSVLAIGRTEKRLAIGRLSDPVEVPWSDICEVEIERNGESLVRTNRGSQVMGAAVGAVLLGPMGLLLGGLTGSKRNEQRVNDLTLKVVLDNVAEPVHRVQFFKHGGKGVKPNAFVLKEPARQIEHFQALIANAIRSGQIDRTTPSPALPAAAAIEDRVSQLWQLKENGALSEDEFMAAKASVLSGSTPPAPSLLESEAPPSVSGAPTVDQPRVYGSGAYPLTEAELSVYGDDQLRALERVLERGDPRVQQDVAATICQKIGWNTGSGDERHFLESYYAALREWRAEVTAVSGNDHRVDVQ